MSEQNYRIDETGTLVRKYTRRQSEQRQKVIIARRKIIRNAYDLLRGDEAQKQLWNYLAFCLYGKQAPIPDDDIKTALDVIRERGNILLVQHWLEAALLRSRVPNDK